MDNYRRRLLVYFNAQPSSSGIIDPTIQDVPNGVYIEDTDGILYRKSAWPSSGVTPNSVVVITNDCKVRLALTLAPNTMKIDPNGGMQDSTVTGIHDITEARTDYNGALNTANILKIQSGTNYAAGYCANFTFPDGITKGCLPAFGLMYTIAKYYKDIPSYLSICGGTEMASPPQHYWTSTYDYTYTDTNYSVAFYWKSLWDAGSGVSVTADESYYVRPVAEYKPIAKVDLSMVSGTRNTANCYMVHEAGTYKIPLVYGNAIKNGLDNRVAYKPGTVANGLANFINHAGTAISAPWITKSGTGVDGGMGITVDGAQLIWQDVDGLTTNYNIEGDYLTFEVPSFVEGNAVIAVKSGSTIVWSWHIWVTSEDYSNLTVVSTGSHNYSVTPCNLGWVPTSENKKQGYCPYYQWGRKDAFPSSNGSDNTDKKVYVGTGVGSKGWEYQTAASAVTIGTNIQNPWIFYYNNDTYGPVSTTYYNMWDAQNAIADNVATATEKTIYDPCPPGFCVPTGNLYYYMGRQNHQGWDSTNKGVIFNNIFFPALGGRSSYGVLNGIGLYGSCWSSTPYNAKRGRNIYFRSDTWFFDNSGRGGGVNVRPVAEE